MNDPDPFAAVKMLDPAGFRALNAKAGAMIDRGFPADRAERRRLKRRASVHIDRTHRAATLLGSLPAEGEWIEGTFSPGIDGWALCSAIVELAAPAVVDELLIASLSVNEQTVQDMAAKMDAGSIKAIPLVLISHYFRHQDAEVFQALQSTIEWRGGRVVVCRCHAKCQAFRLSDGRKIVASGSYNLRGCKSVENYIIRTDAASFDSAKAWMTDPAFHSVREDQ